MELQERIIKVATQLFLENGVKNITMNRLVQELHTSKRTLYQYFEDKTALVKVCLFTYYAKIREDNEAVIKASDNAIEAMGRLFQKVVFRDSQVNPNFFKDITHYYPGLLVEAYRSNNSFAHTQLMLLAQWGIKDGLFLKDMDIEVNVKTVLTLLKLLTNNQEFPVNRYTKERLTFGIMVPYLRGVCTDKGLKLVKEQEAVFKVVL